MQELQGLFNVSQQAQEQLMQAVSHEQAKTAAAMADAAAMRKYQEELQSQLASKDKELGELQAQVSLPLCVRSGVVAG